MKEPDRSLSFKAAAAALRPRKMGADRPARGCAACLAHWRWGTDGGWGAGNNVAVKLLFSRKDPGKDTARSRLAAKGHTLKAR